MKGLGAPPPPHPSGGALPGRVRVVGLGQAAAGDDGVGLAVLEALARRGVPDGVELARAADATALIGLVETPLPVVVVDAALAEPPGRVLVLGPDELAVCGVQPVSSHGVGAGEAIALARTLSPERVSPCIRIVAVTIARPGRYREGLSPAAARAVGVAAERVLALCAAPPGPGGASVGGETARARPRAAEGA